MVKAWMVVIVDDYKDSDSGKIASSWIILLMNNIGSWKQCVGSHYDTGLHYYRMVLTQDKMLWLRIALNMLG